MASLLDAAGEWLERTNPQITREPIVDAGGVPTYWFLEPKQYILETIIVNAVFIPFAWWLNRKPWPVDIPRARTVADKKGPPTVVPGWLTALDYFLRVVCVACLGATLFYKLTTGRFVYCFQPCHLSNLLLTYLCFSRSETAGKLFYFYVNFLYGTVLALVTPDTRGLERPFEIEYFFGQHIMLLLLPCVWIATRRYDMYKGPRVTVATWAIATLLHFDTLWPISVLLRGNVNYMLAPPKVYPHDLYPQYYRAIVTAFCLSLHFLSRYVFAEAAIVVCGVRGQLAKEQEAAAAALATAAVEDVVDLKPRAAGGGKDSKAAATAGGAAGGAGAMPVPTGGSSSGTLRHRTPAKQ